MSRRLCRLRTCNCAKRVLPTAAATW
jgi:hypothetical protein